MYLRICILYNIGPVTLGENSKNFFECFFIVLTGAQFRGQFSWDTARVWPEMFRKTTKMLQKSPDNESYLGKK
jgi:hypothetical protein